MKWKWLAGGKARSPSPPSRGAWIEIGKLRLDSNTAPQSPPSRGAWIEIGISRWGLLHCYVAPLAGGVD